MDRFTCLLFLLLLQCCLCHAGFAFLVFFSHDLCQWPGLPLYCGPQNSPGKMELGHRWTIVRCCPSLYKTRVYPLHPRMCLWVLGRSPICREGLSYVRCHTWAQNRTSNGAEMLEKSGDSRTWEIFPCAVLTGLKIQSDLSVEPPDRSCNLWATPVSSQPPAKRCWADGGWPQGCCFPSKYLWGKKFRAHWASLWRKKFFFLSGYLERHHAI